MAIAQDHPYGNAQYRVDIPAFPQAQAFDEVLLPELLIEVEEFREGMDLARTPRKSPAMIRYTDLVLRRGFAGQLDLYQWWTLAASSNPTARQTVVVHLLNENRDVVVSWRLTNAFPVRYAFSPLNALDGSLLVETLEVSCDSVALE